MTNQMILFDQNFLLELIKEQHKETYAKITVLDFKTELPNETIEGKITQGSMNVDGKSAVRRSCSLTMVTNEINKYNLLWSLGNKFSLEIGLKNQINKKYPEVIWFPFGVFVFTSFSMSETISNYTISLQAQDKMCLLNGTVGGNLSGINHRFDIIEESDRLGNYVERKIPITQIIRELIHTFGGEPYYNIILNDIDEYGYNQLNYAGDESMYLLIPVENASNGNRQIILSQEYEIYLYKEEENNYQNKFQISKLEEENYGQYYTEYEDFNRKEIKGSKVKKANGEDNNIYYVQRFTAGQPVGYEATKLIYPEELTAKANETIVSVLDKIKKTFSNFEYFYNIDGRFIFQKQKTYVESNFPIEITQGNNSYFVPQQFSSGISFSFDDYSMIIQLNNSPQIGNIKNDFSVWGSRAGSGNEIPILYRFAIDKKPSYYRTIWITEDEINTFNFNQEPPIPRTLEKYQRDIIYTTNAAEVNISEIKSLPEIKVVDWREIIYQMALDQDRWGAYLNNFRLKLATANPEHYPNGKTGYEQYYIDMLGMWRQIYNPEPEEYSLFTPELKNDLYYFVENDIKLYEDGVVTLSGDAQISQFDKFIDFNNNNNFKIPDLKNINSAFIKWYNNNGDVLKTIEDQNLIISSIFRFLALGRLDSSTDFNYGGSRAFRRFKNRLNSFLATPTMETLISLKDTLEIWKWKLYTPLNQIQKYEIGNEVKEYNVQKEVPELNINLFKVFEKMSLSFKVDDFKPKNPSSNLELNFINSITQLINIIEDIGYCFQNDHDKLFCFLEEIEQNNFMLYINEIYDLWKRWEDFITNSQYLFELYTFFGLDTENELDQSEKIQKIESLELNINDLGVNFYQINPEQEYYYETEEQIYIPASGLTLDNNKILTQNIKLQQYFKENHSLFFKIIDEDNLESEENKWAFQDLVKQGTVFLQSDNFYQTGLLEKMSDETLKKYNTIKSVMTTPISNDTVTKSYFEFLLYSQNVFNWLLGGFSFNHQIVFNNRDPDITNIEDGLTIYRNYYKNSNILSNNLEAVSRHNANQGFLLYDKNRFEFYKLLLEKQELTEEETLDNKNKEIADKIKKYFTNQSDEIQTIKINNKDFNFHSLNYYLKLFSSIGYEEARILLSNNPFSQSLETWYELGYWGISYSSSNNSLNQSNNIYIRLNNDIQNFIIRVNNLMVKVATDFISKFSYYYTIENANNENGFVFLPEILSNSRLKLIYYKTELLNNNLFNETNRLSRLEQIGDVNFDGLVNNLDAAQVLKYIEGLKIFSKEQEQRADVNFDNEINEIDARNILKYDADLIESFDDIIIDTNLIKTPQYGKNLLLKNKNRIYNIANALWNYKIFDIDILATTEDNVVVKTISIIDILTDFCWAKIGGDQALALTSDKILLKDFIKYCFDTVTSCNNRLEKKKIEDKLNSIDDIKILATLCDINLNGYIDALDFYIFHNAYESLSVEEEELFKEVDIDKYNQYKQMTDNSVLILYFSILKGLLILFGDLNLNNLLTTLDAYSLLKYLSDLTLKLDYRQLLAADLNQDGLINEIDYIELMYSDSKNNEQKEFKHQAVALKRWVTNEEEENKRTQIKYFYKDFVLFYSNNKNINLFDGLNQNNIGITNSILFTNKTPESRLETLESPLPFRAYPQYKDLETKTIAIKYFLPQNNYNSENYWHNNVISAPDQLNFWFDFLDSPNSELGAFEVGKIGDRTKVLQDTKIKSLFYFKIPEILYYHDIEPDIDSSYQKIGLTNLSKEEYNSLFATSSQGRSAKEKIDELLGTHSYGANTINLTTIPIYFLEPNTRVSIVDKNNGISNEYLISKLTIPLTYNGNMTITGSLAPQNIY